MVKVTKWSEKRIAPGFLIDCAKATPFGKHPQVCDFRGQKSFLYREWACAEEYMRWAEAGLAKNDPEGFDTALTYAKRAVCRRIDGFLAYNHLWAYEREGYPDKVNMLNEIGIEIPDVVHALAIDPRNASEHHYQAVEQEIASRAVGTAKMFLRATKEEAKRIAVVALNWNLKRRSGYAESPAVSTNEDFTDQIMLLVDIFEEPHKVKLVRPCDAEIEYAELDSFERADSIELAKLLRAHYDGEHGHGFDAFSYLRYLTEAKIAYPNDPLVTDAKTEVGLALALKHIIKQK